MNFTKLHSLGNDFILLDWRNRDWQDKTEQAITKIITQKTWQNFVVSSCKRRYGIGADGILVLYKKDNQHHVLIFNADGSQAELCLNGARCVAHYVHSKNNTASNINIYMSNKRIACAIN